MKTKKTVAVPFFLLFFAPGVHAQNRVGGIEFFGAKGIDVAAVGQTLPIHSGDTLAPGWKEQVRAAVAKATGAEPTDVAGICCDETHATTVFIGMKGKSYKPSSFRPTPSGTDALPDSALALVNDTEAAARASVYSGDAEEDDSKGYALSKNPGPRALQMKMRAFAVAHEPELIAVIAQARDAKQRRAASELLGYATASTEQVHALVQAANDPDEDVRNNATRALGVLLNARPEFARAIDPAGPIAMLYSGVWTDRNKSSFLLEAMTASRDLGLLKRLREQAWDTLLEMADWKDFGHAFPSRVILGRVLGIPEDRLQRLLLSKTGDQIMKSAR